MKKLLALIVLLASIMISPLTTHAMEYSIDHMKIDAFLQKDGMVDVTEVQVYSFEGKFKGITRTLIPKKGTQIIDVKATENGKKLKVEQDDNEYKIYRKGKDEEVTINLTYTIKNGVQRYSDVGQFNWPFFDESNESDYEQFDVYVHPPQPTEDVIAFGDEEAFGTANINDGGIVHFAMGKVPEGSNGNIRVAYDAELFPGTALTKDKPMREEILAAKTELQEKQAAFEERKEFLANLAPYIVGVFVFYFLGLCFYAWQKKRVTGMEMERRFPAVYFIPKADMSMPATISFMNSGIIGAEALTAALMDLVRKGYVKRKNEDTFDVVHRNTDYQHENFLIHWLFDTIGKNGVFRLEDLEKYTKKKANQSKYRKDFETWKQAVQDEVKSHHLYKKKTKIRVWAGLSSILLIPLVILFGVHELFMWVFFSILLFIGLGLFALFYRPRTIKGTKVVQQWKAFKEKYPEINVDEWNEQMDDDQKRAFIFGVGMNDKRMKKKNEQLLEAIPPTSYAGSDLVLFTAIAAASTSFESANNTASASSPGGTPGGGAGVGGGGGGSGAF
ncbi:DUF2207 domain-containing protein [Virgibacillus dakarensis]|uniref:DUF2207 domain-containing protein n=1 Tax=Virgibacillus dakarensis TaxID=1917889 RepID=UPI000B44F016|nr:DUF2207 domain-containing protein [Virgibacillus dakarensis]MTW87339.1 DUF2207 domain-containing protein [Virgibacillus dakarensis]